MAIEVTTATAAEMLGVTPHQVRWYHAQGLLPARRIEDATRRPPVLMFKRADVESFKKPKKTGRPRKLKPTNGEPAKKGKSNGN